MWLVLEIVPVGVVLTAYFHLITLLFGEKTNDVYICRYEQLIIFCWH